MITIIASLVGFLGSVMPDCFRLVADKRDKAHELKIMSMQIQMQKQKIYDSHVTNLEEIRINHESNEQRILHRNFFSGHKVIDAINASVRPILAYSFFALYSVSKIMQFLLIDDFATNEAFLTMSDLVHLQLSHLWGEEDQAIFSGILSFYFGQRSLNKRFK